MPQPGWLVNNRSSFLTALEAGSLRPGWQGGLQGGQRLSSRFQTSLRVLVLWRWRGFTLESWSPPEAAPPNPITLRIRVSTMISKGPNPSDSTLSLAFVLEKASSCPGIHLRSGFCRVRLCGGLQHVCLSPVTRFLQLRFFLYPGGHPTVVSGGRLL